MDQPKRNKRRLRFNTWANDPEPQKTTAENPLERADQPGLPPPEEEKPTPGKVRPAAPPSKTGRKKKIFLNTVVSNAMNARINQAVATYQVRHGKTFGRSAWARMAFIAQLERDEK